jgi:hypothetical protein
MRRFVTRYAAGGAAAILLGGILSVVAAESPAFAAASLKYTSATWVGGVPYGGTGNISGISVSASGYADSTAITFSFTSPSTCPAGATLGNGAEAYSSTSSSYATTTSASGAATAVIYEPGTDPAQSATECEVQGVANVTEDTAAADTIAIQTAPLFSSAASATVWAPDDNPVNESIDGSTGYDNLNFDVIAVGNGITTIDDTGGLAGLGTVSGFSGGSCADPITLATDEIECVLSGTPASNDAGPAGSLATAYPDTLSTTDANSNTTDQSFNLDVNPAPQCDIATSGTDAADVLSGTVDPEITTGNADNLNDGGAAISLSGSANTSVYIGCNPTISGDDALMVPASPLADVIGSTTTASVPNGTTCYNGNLESDNTCPSNGGESEGGEGTITILADNISKITKWTTGATSTNSPTSAASTAFDGSSTIPDPANFASSVGYSTTTGDENPDVPADGGAAECPPQPALVDAGLAFCESEPVSDNGDTYYTDQVYLDYSGGTDANGYSQSTTPNNPVLDLDGSNSTAVSFADLGTPVTLGDNSCDTNITDVEINSGTTADCWWNNADNTTSGANNYSTSTTDLSASDVTLSGGSLSGPETLDELGGSASNLQVTPARYTEGWYDHATPASSTLNTGYLTPPELSGSITLPSNLPIGDYTVTLEEPLGSSAGDGEAYLDSSGSISASATLDVTMATSTTVSQPGSSSVYLGASNTDSATVTGSDPDVDPTGSVDFYYCGPDLSPTACTSGSWTGLGTEMLSGNANPDTVESPDFTPPTSGYWCFAAVYQGDSNYQGSNDETSGDECFDVGATGSTTSSTPASDTIALGAGNSDSATVTGSVNDVDPTGSVSFYYCGPDGSATPCTSDTQTLLDTVDLSGSSNPNTVNSVSFTPTGAGYWCFEAVYSGDGNYTGSSDDSMDECFHVTQGTSSTSSNPASGSIVLGTTDSDTATVTGSVGSVDPTGSVSFYECSPVTSPCDASTGTFIDSASLGGTSNPGTAASASFLPTSVGTWCFAAVYSGDSDFTGSSDTSTDECFRVTRATATFSTSPLKATSTYPAAETDTATVVGNSAGGLPTGTVTFYICGPTPSPTACTALTKKVGSAVALRKKSGKTATATSKSFTPSGGPGYYCFAAVYSGDTHYVGATDNSSTTECFFSESPPTITSFSPSSGTPGSNVTIRGMNLEYVSSVTIDGKTATVNSQTATKIVAVVPATAATGKIVVSGPYGNATSKTRYKVT